MLNLASNAPGIFQPEHVEIAQEIADSLAVAIQQMQLRRADQQRRQEAEAMRDVMSALASAANINQALEIILVRLRDLIPYDRAGIFFLDENQHYQLAEKSPYPKAGGLRLHPSQDPLVEELKKVAAPDRGERYSVRSALRDLARHAARARLAGRSPADWR